MQQSSSQRRISLDKSESKVNPELLEKQEQDDLAFVQSNINNEEERIKAHNESLQIARFTDLSQIKQSGVIIYVGCDDETTHVIFIFGQKLPCDQKSLDKTYYYFISLLNEKKIQKYAIVYFHTGTSSFEIRQFNLLKQWYKTLPMKFLLNLQALYVVHPSILAKLDNQLAFTFASKFLQKKIYYIGGLEELQEKEFFQEKFWKELPSYVWNHEQDFMKRKSSLLNQFSQSEQSKEKILGLDIEKMKAVEIGVPVLIVALAAFFEQKKQSYKIEGIFRKSGSINEETQLLEALQNQDFKLVYQIENVNVIAGMMKKIFNKMPTPLFSYELYDMIVQFKEKTQSDLDSQIKYLSEIIQRLPQQNRNTLIFMIKFLKKVLEFSEFNKMNAYNVSVVFAPNFFRPQTCTASDLVNAGTMVYCLKLLIQEFQQIFDKFLVDQIDFESITQSFLISNQIDQNLEKYQIFQDLEEVKNQQ